MPTPITVRKEATTSKQYYQSLSTVSNVAIRNGGINDVKIQFVGDGDNDYYTLKAGSLTPSFRIDFGEKIYYTSVLGTSNIEFLLWD